MMYFEPANNSKLQIFPQNPLLLQSGVLTLRHSYNLFPNGQKCQNWVCFHLYQTKLPRNVTNQDILVWPGQSTDKLQSLPKKFYNPRKCMEQATHPKLPTSQGGHTEQLKSIFSLHAFCIQIQYECTLNHLRVQFMNAENHIILIKETEPKHWYRYIDKKKKTAETEDNFQNNLTKKVPKHTLRVTPQCIKFFLCTVESGSTQESHLLRLRLRTLTA